MLENDELKTKNCISFAKKGDFLNNKNTRKEMTVLKAGSWVHNTIGILLILVSILQAVNNWADSKPKSIFYILFAAVVAVLLVFLTKKRKEINREGK